MSVQPLEPQREVPPEQLEFARAFIARCGFVYARSVPRHPHEYALRAWLDDERRGEFDRFARLIREYGYRGRFVPAPGANAGAPGVYTYLNVDRWRFWLTPSIDRTSLILNRAVVDEPGEQLRLVEGIGGE